MNAQWQSRATIFNKLRVKHSQFDTAATRLRISTALNTVDLTPSSLSPSAILVIRKLCDPLPGALKFQAMSMGLPAAWQQALTVSIEQLARRASRPILGAVPAGAEAVIFMDKSELLACLAHDWCAGNLAVHWWWPSLFRIADAKQLIFNQWLGAPQYLPAAFAHLAQRDMVKAFILKFTRDEVVTLLNAIIHTFALIEIQSLLNRVPRPGDGQRPVAGETKKTWSPKNAPVAVHASASAGLETEGQEDQNGFSVEHHLLYITGLRLAGAPQQARTKAFAQQLERRLQDLTGDDNREFSSRLDDLPEANKPRRKAKSESLKTATEAMTTDEFIESQPASSTRPTGLSEAESGGQNAQFTRSTRARENSENSGATLTDDAQPQSDNFAPTRQDQLRATNPADDWPDTVAGLSVEAKAALPSLESEARQPGTEIPNPDFYEAILFEADIETGLGGTFYLINLGLFLNLYGDFTSPLRPGIGLAIWDFLTLLGQHFCGGQFEDDPLWGLLAKLAGRGADEGPGKGFVPPAEWRVPGEWLKPFRNGACWHWHSSAKRLRIIHPAGFAIVDVPLAGDRPAARLAQELQAYSDMGKVNLQPAFISDAVENPSPLQQWLAWLMPYVKARLARAVAVQSESQLAKVLLQHPAHVQVTPVRLDVFFDLSELPIEIRLSGLDRNPGWVPAAGRFIEFHFN